MDPRLLRYYNQELRYLREMGAEFAQEFPKIASRLGMDGLEVADPYVERLLEGSAFLSARVQLKLDAEFPQLSQRLLDMVCPNLSAPVPSMLVVQLQPQVGPNLLEGVDLPRGSALIAGASAVSSTACEFRTCQAATLTPLKVEAAEYFINAADLNLSSQALPQRPRAGVRVRLSLPQGQSFRQLTLDHVRFYLAGQQDIAFQLLELMLGSCCGVLVGAPAHQSATAHRLLPGAAVQAVGYSDAQAMLPVTQRGLTGTRLMQEYFAFAQRFLFVDVCGVQSAFAVCDGAECELVLLFNRQGEALDGAVSAENFALHCVPAINLFERRADRVPLDDSHFEFQVLPDRSAPGDFEVHSIVNVQGMDRANQGRPFYPLYATPHGAPHGHQAFWSAQRQPRAKSDKVRREGPRSGYLPSDVFISLVDGQEQPSAQELWQLSVSVMTSNADLPLFMPMQGMQLREPAPVARIDVVAGPSRPLSAVRAHKANWQLVNLLSLNHLSLLESDAVEGAQALRELLRIFAMSQDASTQAQIEGVRHVSLQPVVRRHPTPGPLAFGRGVQVEVEVDDIAFEGSSAFLLGSVLHHYFAKHVALNNFVQTSLRTMKRGPVMCWKPVLGERGII